jgi:hypothetical protein
MHIQKNQIGGSPQHKTDLKQAVGGFTSCAAIRQEAHGCCSPARAHQPIGRAPQPRCELLHNVRVQPLLAGIRGRGHRSGLQGCGRGRARSVACAPRGPGITPRQTSGMGRARTLHVLLLRRHVELGSGGLDDCHVQVLRRELSPLSSPPSPLAAPSMPTSTGHFAASMPARSHRPES